jgi:hypothetical protein
MASLTDLEYKFDQVSVILLEKFNAFAETGEHIDLGKWLQ